MENCDRDRILAVLNSNIQLKRLYQEHLSFEDRLAQFSSKKFLTPEEQMEAQRLKKLKLKGVDQMMTMISAEGAPL